MEYEEAKMVRDQLRAIQACTVWQVYILPHLEGICAGHMTTALTPAPNDPGHEAARYRLAALREFQDFLTNLESNAAQIAGDGDPSLRDKGPNEAVVEKADPSAGAM
jgi:hypothetical protein